MAVWRQGVSNWAVHAVSSASCALRFLPRRKRARNRRQSRRPHGHRRVVRRRGPGGAQLGLAQARALRTRPRGCVGVMAARGARRRARSDHAGQAFGAFGVFRLRARTQDDFNAERKRVKANPADGMSMRDLSRSVEVLHGWERKTPGSLRDIASGAGAIGHAWWPCGCGCGCPCRCRWRSGGRQRGGGDEGGSSLGGGPRRQSGRRRDAASGARESGIASSTRSPPSAVLCPSRSVAPWSSAMLRTSASPSPLPGACCASRIRTGRSGRTRARAPRRECRGRRPRPPARPGYAAALQAEVHAAAAVLDAVVQQVAQQHRQRLAMAVDQHRVAALHAEVDAARLRQRRAVDDGIAAQHVQRDWLRRRFVPWRCPGGPAPAVAR